jgi:hypothetical protein
MHSSVAGALVPLVAIAGHLYAAANIPPEIPKYHLGSCGVGVGVPACMWDCGNARACCGDGTCEPGGCQLDVSDALSAHLVTRVTDCATGGGAIVEFGLRGTRRDGTEFVVPSRTIDLCSADVQCGAFSDCRTCAEPECPTLCSDPETTCPPPLPEPSLFCENPGGGPQRPGGRPEPCRDPPGSDRVPTPGRRFCTADLAEPLRFERWLARQPILQAIRDDLAALHPEAHGPALIASIVPRSDDPLPDRACAESLDPEVATPCCNFTESPNGGREASCCVTVALIRDRKAVAVPADVASAAVGLGSLAVTTNPCEPLCGNGRVDPGEECESDVDSACPGLCQPANHPAACRCDRPPRCDAAAARPNVLWPPNGQRVAVTVDGVTDPDGDPLVIRVVGIAQDEPVVNSKGRRSCPDGQSAPDGSVLLRAARKGAGDGRTYHISFVAEDPHGRQCTGDVTACVPHDGSGSSCGDQGPSFDSTACHH